MVAAQTIDKPLAKPTARGFLNIQKEKGRSVSKYRNKERKAGGRQC